MSEIGIKRRDVFADGVSAAGISQRILVLRGQKILIDVDLAELYGVSTKQLNQQVKPNHERFPLDFVFQLTRQERDEVVTNCDHLAKLKYSHVLPYAFAEHGALMAASVLHSRRAIEVSMFVVRAFVRLRDALSSHKDLARRIEELEARYDRQFKVVFDALRDLMQPPEPAKRRRIGFIQSN